MIVPMAAKHAAINAVGPSGSKGVAEDPACEESDDRANRENGARRLRRTPGAPFALRQSFCLR
jgi:hypothetical protein